MALNQSMKSWPERVLKLVSALVLAVGCLSVASVWADWTDEYVSSIEQQTDALEAGAQNLTNDLLPLAESNTWNYSFDDLAGSEPSVASVSMSLGPLEDLGDFCVRPLILADGRLKLYLANHNDRIVFYGFEGLINGEFADFFFQGGENAGFEAGVPLAGLPESELLATQQNNTQRIINNQAVDVTWFATGKSASFSSLSDPLSGDIGGVSAPVSAGTIQNFSFDLRLIPGPCDLDIGCFAARFEFGLLPGIGLLSMRINGDSNELGGRFDHRYQLVNSSMAYDLASATNQIQYFSCDAQEQDNLGKQSVGFIGIWFIILIGFVVLLRTCVHFALFGPRNAVAE